MRGRWLGAVEIAQRVAWVPLLGGFRAVVHQVVAEAVRPRLARLDLPGRAALFGPHSGQI